MSVTSRLPPGNSKGGAIEHAGLGTARREQRHANQPWQAAVLLDAADSTEEQISDRCAAVLFARGSSHLQAPRPLPHFKPRSHDLGYPAGRIGRCFRDTGSHEVRGSDTRAGTNAGVTPIESTHLLFARSTLAGIVSYGPVGWLAPAGS